MSREKELVKNTAILSVGKLCTQFVSFLLLPLYTSILTKEEYGVYDVYGTYISLLLPLVFLQIEQAVFRFLVDTRGKEQESDELISTAVLFVAAQCVLAGIVYGIARPLMKGPYWIFLLTNTLVTIFSGMMLQLTRGLGDNTTYAVGSFLSALTTVTANVVFIALLRLGPKGLFLSYFLGNLLCGIYVFAKKRIYRRVHLSWFRCGKLKEMMQYGLPLVPNALSWWILGAADKNIVKAVFGVSANGILAVSTKFSTVYTAFYSIFNMTWMESAALYKDTADRDAYFSEIIDTAFRFLSAVILGIIAVMPFVFPLLVNVSFQEAYNQIPIYMISSLFYSLIGLFSAVYTAYKATKEVAKTSFLAAVINVVIDLLLIRRVGLYAASISSAVAYGSMALYRLFDVRNYIRLRVNWKVWAGIVLMGGVVLVSYYRNDLMWNIVTLAVVCAFAVGINRKLLNEMIGLGKKMLSGRKENPK